jgi:uncharacterized membrane protein YdbT with pleckstrin-like domain
MSEIQIRPTVKFVRAGAVALLFVAVVAWGSWASIPDTPILIPIAATALLLWPLAKWIPNRANVTTLTADRLRSENGILSKSTRTLMLARVQDVGVTQRLGQRLMGVGDIWIETAGATSRVVLSNIDAPQRVADLLLDAAEKANPGATLNPPGSRPE